VVTAGVDKTARIWDAQTGEQIQVLTGHTMGLTNIAYSPDGKLIATSSEEQDAIVRIWDAATGQELFSLPPSHGDRIWGLAFSPDGRLLGTSGGDTTAKIWYLDLEASTGHLLSTLTSHTGTVWALAFSPDGKTLASSGAGEAKLWDVSSLLDFNQYTAAETSSLPEMLSLPGGGGIAFSPIDSTLTIGSPDGMVRSYTLSPEELMAIAAERLTRSLTEVECQQYLHLEACPVEE
jgi:WD40 repeat protein